MATDDAASVLRNRNVFLFMAARFCSAMAVMMFSVAVGWQVYALTHSAFALGMVGLAQFLPAFLLTLPGGLAADRFDRRKIILAAFAIQILVGVALLVLALHPAPRAAVGFSWCWRSSALGAPSWRPRMDPCFLF